MRADTQGGSRPGAVNRRTLWLFAVLCVGPAVPGLAAQAQPLPSELPVAPAAPDSFLVAFATTRGTFVMQAHRDWSPLGVDRLYQLVRGRYYDGVVVYRVVGGFVAQFGVGNSAAVNAAWDSAGIPDEPVRRTNGRGMVSFARDGPHSRSVNLFVNLAANTRLDTLTARGVVGYPPIGEVVEGMAVLDSLNRQYGNAVFEHWDSIMASGRDYLDRAFPGLDRIDSVSILTVWPGGAPR